MSTGWFRITFAQFHLRAHPARISLTPDAKSSVSRARKLKSINLQQATKSCKENLILVVRRVLKRLSLHHSISTEKDNSLDCQFFSCIFFSIGERNRTQHYNPASSSQKSSIPAAGDSPLTGSQAAVMRAGKRADNKAWTAKAFLQEEIHWAPPGIHRNHEKGEFRWYPLWTHSRKPCHIHLKPAHWSYFFNQ